VCTYIRTYAASQTAAATTSSTACKSVLGPKAAAAAGWLE